MTQQPTLSANHRVDVQARGDHARPELALADKYTAVGPAPVPATDVAASLRDVLATLTLNAKVA